MNEIAQARDLMSDALIFAVALMGLVGPLLPRSRGALLVLTHFAIGNGVLLFEVDDFLQTDPSPGPDARGLVVFAYFPSANFAIACVLRILFETVRYALRRFRGRRERENGARLA